MKFRPCIDLHNGAVKQIVGATLVDGQEPETNFESKMSSEEFAKMYKESKLFGGHVIKLGKGNEEAAIAALKAFPGGLQLGGGVTAENATTYLDAGASHVIVTSYVFNNGSIDFDRLKALVDKVTKEKLVLDLSCRKKPTSKDEASDDNYYVVTNLWQEYTDFAVTKENIELLSEYCDEFLVHGVENEGKRLGVIEDLVEKLGEWSPIPVTYAGGAKSLEDFDLVKKLGKGKVDLTIGSALDIFGGSIPYESVCQWHNAQQETPVVVSDAKPEEKDSNGADTSSNEPPAKVAKTDDNGAP